MQFDANKAPLTRLIAKDVGKALVCASFNVRRPRVVRLVWAKQFTKRRSRVTKINRLADDDVVNLEHYQHTTCAHKIDLEFHTIKSR